MVKVLATVHQDYLPFILIASNEQLGEFIRAQINQSQGKAVDQMSSIAQALLDTHNALTERLETSKISKSEAGKESARRRAEEKAELERLKLLTSAQHCSTDVEQSSNTNEHPLNPIPFPIPNPIPKPKEYKNISLDSYRSRYDDEQLKVIDDFFTVLKHTRASAKIADSVIENIYKSWEAYEAERVVYCLKKYINSPQLHDKKENYVLGIIRNTTMAEVHGGSQQINFPRSNAKMSFDERFSAAFPNEQQTDVVITYLPGGDEYIDTS